VDAKQFDKAAELIDKPARLLPTAQQLEPATR